MSDNIKKLKTLIVIDNLHVGGVATSLYNFLVYATRYFDIDLFVFNEQSVDSARLPDGVNVLKIPKKLKILGMGQSEIKKYSFRYALKRAFYVGLTRLTSGQFARSILFLTVKRLKKYDLAIAYAQDNAWKSLSKGCIDFVVKKVDAKKKMAFIHCDYSNFGGYNKKQEIMLSRLDYINCVSESCKKSFIDKFPTLQSKCIVIENFIDYKKVVELSNEYETEFANDDYFVSACRLSPVKGLDRTIGVLGELNKERAINCKWVIVGDGPERENLEVSIDECGLKNIVFLIGEKENPYPYIKKARAFLLPSYHEAAPMVYGESAALGVPIVSTDTCSAEELVKDRNIGIVVDNNEAGIKRGLNEIIDGTVESNRIGVEEINKIAESQLKNLYIELCKT